MHPSHDLIDAATRMSALIAAVESGQLSAPTPCPHFDVRALVNHLIAWSPFIVAVGCRQPVTGRPDERTDHMSGDWCGDYLDWIKQIVAVWGKYKAWEGTVDLSFARVPADTIGGKTLCEFVLHGWDLAQATGQKYECEATVAATTRAAVVARTAEETRRLGMFGPPVPVDATASDLEHALGASGRDPYWAG